jgi:hypothetical protein
MFLYSLQAAHLLEAPKGSADDITFCGMGGSLGSGMYCCNSSLSWREFNLKHVEQMLVMSSALPFGASNKWAACNEYKNIELDQVVRVAEHMEDEQIKSDGRDVHLEEDPYLQLPFLIPEDGYSCDTIRGIPNGLYLLNFYTFRKLYHAKKKSQLLTIIYCWFSVTVGLSKSQQHNILIFFMGLLIKLYLENLTSPVNEVSHFRLHRTSGVYYSHRMAKWFFSKKKCSLGVTQK